MLVQVVLLHSTLTLCSTLSMTTIMIYCVLQIIFSQYIESGGAMLWISIATRLDALPTFTSTTYHEIFILVCNNGPSRIRDAGFGMFNLTRSDSILSQHVSLESNRALSKLRRAAV
ncbi:hypothetical protein C8R47DRAFT_608303 [Mycena vitilis]|nr:hypothetical protein C8R47DRAFT_608303 [Mycena vitilis]